jgi:FPC/CPF motif-containing protein YcgG
MQTESEIIAAYSSFLSAREYPCIAAKASLARGQIHCMVAEHMACPADDSTILKFIYKFIDAYRTSGKSYHSVAVIFKLPHMEDELVFDNLLWQRLNALALMDRKTYAHDNRVDSDPASGKFSFSLKEEAFFVIGLHPASNRRSRRFTYPTLVFNPHAEFERLRKLNRYERMKKIVRKRDHAFSGSENPMLKDFGEASEVFQYSGVNYQADWKCPLRNFEANDEHHSST